MMRMTIVIQLTLPNWHGTFLSEVHKIRFPSKFVSILNNILPFFSLQWKCDKIQFGDFYKPLFLYIELSFIQYFLNTIKNPNIKKENFFFYNNAPGLFNFSFAT